MSAAEENEVPDKVSEEPAGAVEKKPAGEGGKQPAAKEPRPGKRPRSGERSSKPKGKPQVRRGRGRRQAPTPTRRVVRARARYVRTSARKARMVCGQLRGKSVAEARAILAFTPRDVARAWSKLLESAVANAESNHELLEDDLVVREAYADEGPTIRRFRPRAMGRATPIRKRTSHLTITLAAGSPARTSKQ
jgi:ribosomal protein L22